MSNRGSVSTNTIAEKLKKVENDLGIKPESINAKRSPLLFVSGRLDRKNYVYTPKNFSLLEPLNNEIKELCKGGDLAILNYLIFLGLNKVKENKGIESVEYSEFEKSWNDNDVFK